MNKLGFALAAGLFAALGRAVTLLVQPAFVESNAAHAVLDGLFVGATVYVGLEVLKRTADSNAA